MAFFGTCQKMIRGFSFLYSFNFLYSSISMVSIAMIIIVIYYHPYTVAPEPSSVGICSSYLMDPSVEGNLSEQIECFLSAMMWVGALRWSPFFGLFMVWFIGLKYIDNGLVTIEWRLVCGLDKGVTFLFINITIRFF